MSELWALLHFIMPNLFDSHEQFQEWFSKDIEAHSQDKGELNKEQRELLMQLAKTMNEQPPVKKRGLFG